MRGAKAEKEGEEAGPGGEAAGGAEAAADVVNGEEGGEVWDAFEDRDDEGFRQGVPVRRRLWWWRLRIVAE